MAESLDLYILPIHRREGIDLASLPGLHITSRPRRTARSRSNDQLILFIAFSGTATISPQGKTQLLKNLAQTYYRTPGAVTSALRAAAESLNHILLENNRHSTDNIQAIGLLTLIVVQQNRLYVGQSGPTHIFNINSTESHHLYDLQLSGHGLGLGRATTIRFSHVPLEIGSLLIYSTNAPDAWSAESLRKAYGVKFATLHRGLMKYAGDDLEAILIQARPGKGNLHLISASPSWAMEEEKPKEEQSPSQAAPLEAETERQFSEAEVHTTELPSEVDSTDSPIPDEETVLESSSQETATFYPENFQPPEEIPLPLASLPPHPEPANAPIIAEAVPEHTYTSAPEEPASEPIDSSIAEEIAPKTSQTPAPEKPPREPVIGPMILTVARAFGESARQLGKSIRAFITRLLPSNELFTIPSSVMALFAIAIPLVLVTISSVVYLRRGRLIQYDEHIRFAEAAKLNAQGKTDPAEIRASWDAVIFYVDRAETYQTTTASQTLRDQAQTILDELDSTERLLFQPAIEGGLAENVQIKRMFATTDAIYLLNSVGANVIRAWRTGRGYEIDPNFRCGPGSYGSYLVGELIDIAPLPKNNSLDATLIGMDKNGVLVYCLLDKPLLASPLAPPDSNWGAPIGFTLDSGTLYVLDPETNAVWVYDGDDYSFVERPYLFFDENIPPMEDVIDLAVNRSDLYLLHADGHITTCTINFTGQPTRCTDPAPFTDNRPGRQSDAVIADTQFDQIAFTLPPDPSIYLLDPSTQAIYHFSLRLTLQRQYRSQNPTPAVPATAFALSPNRMMFIAFGNEVFTARLP